MADEHPDDASPWKRDDWVADSAIPDAAVYATGVRPPSGPGRPPGDPHEPPPEDFDDGDARSSTSTLGRKVVAGAVIAALLIGSAGALLGGGGEPAEVPDPAVTSVAERSPTTTSDTIPPTTLQTLTASPPEASTDLGFTDPIPLLVAGEPPTWAERQIAVPENLASMASTEDRFLQFVERGTGAITQIDDLEHDPTGYGVRTTGDRRATW